MLIGGHSPAAEYYLSPKGDDANPGTKSQPWGTLQHAVDRDSLSPGDTLFVRGGTYFEKRRIVVKVNGTEEAPIAIRGYRDEEPVIDGSYEELLTVPNQHWKLHDEKRSIYRSVRRYERFEEEKVHGCFESGDRKYSLVPYMNYNHLAADDEHFKLDGFTYVGPGFHFNPEDKHLYVRLTKTAVQREMELIYPVQNDPNQVKLHIFSSDLQLLMEDHGRFTHWEGIHFAHRGNPASIWIHERQRHITMKNCTVTGGINVRAKDVMIDGVHFQGFIPPYIAWADIKEGRAPAFHIQSGGLMLIGRRGIVRNCLFTNLFDGVTPGPEAQVYNNRFIGLRDDGINLGTSLGGPVEIHHNLFRHIGQGISHVGTGEPKMQGQIYIHHNIIDQREPHLKSRKQADGTYWGYKGPNGKRMSRGVPFGWHNQTGAGPDPWKLYNNTVICGYSRLLDSASQKPGFTEPQEVYNNVYIQLHDRSMRRLVDVTSGRNLFDGNLYFRPNGNEKPLFAGYRNGEGNFRPFPTLDDFKQDEYFDISKKVYPPGFENSSVEADPKLDEHYRPAPDSPAASGAIDLSNRGWPGLDGKRYRGAVLPSGEGWDQQFYFDATSN